MGLGNNLRAEKQYRKIQKSGMKSHRDLDVWQRAMDFTVIVYEVTRGFPKDEVYGLTSQMRRAGVSIPSNIAEGAARAYSAEYVRFLNIAIGSASELDTRIEIAGRLGYLSEAAKAQLTSTAESLSRSLISLRNSIQRRIDR